MQKKSSRKGFRQRLDDMVNTLRDEIISGKLASGCFLPSESDLEKLFQLSNNSIRKGLETLVMEGLIEKIPRVGNRVRSLKSEPITTIKFGYFNWLTRLIEMEPLLAEFQQQYPHIQVQPLEIPSSSFSTALKEYMEAEMLDVVIINNNNFQDFVESGCTELLEPLDVNEEFYSFLTTPFMEDGRTFVQPFIYSPVVLCYNRDHFRQQQVPEPDSSWSWHDLFRYSQQLAVKNERFGFYFHLLSRNRWPVFMLQSGMAFEPDQEGQYHLCGTKLMESLEICRELLTMTDVFPVMLSESDADAETLFMEEKVSVIMTTYFFLSELRNSHLSFDVSPLPRFQDSKTLLIIGGLAVNSRSRSKEAANQLVQFLSSYETQLQIRQKTLNIPAHRRAVEWQGEELVYRPSRFFMYREILPTFRLITELGLRNKQLKAIEREIMLFLSGLQDNQMLCKRVEQLLSLQSEKA